MNSHLLPFPYNQARPPRRWHPPLTRLANCLYHLFPLPKRPPPLEPPIKIVCISDTHNTQPALPNGDLLLHAGDLTQNGTIAELQAQLTWLASQPHSYKVVIAGNHDRCLSRSTSSPLTADATPTDEQLDWGAIIYLENTSTSLIFPGGRKLTIYGSPYTPEFGTWVFQYPPLRDMWTNSIPEGTDIVLVHGPPALHLDLGGKGCEFLLKEGVRGGVLSYDGMQEAWEGVLLRRGVVRAVAEMVVWGVWGFVRRMVWHLPARAVTDVVNAAVFTGPGERGMEAVVVKL